MTDAEMLIAINPPWVLPFSDLTPELLPHFSGQESEMSLQALSCSGAAISIAGDEVGFSLVITYFVLRLVCDHA